MVGDLIGAGASQEQAVVGETPNLAARLQALAAANAVLIGDRTRRLIGGLFEIDGLGPQQLAGFLEPQPRARIQSGHRSFVGLDFGAGNVLNVNPTTGASSALNAGGRSSVPASMR